MSFDVFRPKCRLCRCPVVDGGVSLSEVDKDKLANWWLTRRGVPIDEASIETSWVCLNCVREANYNHECSTERDFDCVWWPEMDPHYKYFLEGWIKSCSVPLKKLNEEELEDIQHVGHKNCSSPLLAEHQNFLCKFEHCQAVFSRESELKKHSSEFHMGMNIFKKMEDLYIECQFCLKTYPKSKNRNSHFTKTPCTSCKKVFPCRGLLIKHKKRCSFKCNICGLKFKRSRNLVKHEKKCQLNSNLTRKNLYTCNFCSKGFLTKTPLRYHIEKYHIRMQKSLFPCELCDKTFFLEFSFKNHMITIHNINLGLSKCSICSNYTANLDLHMKQKHDQKQDTIYVECDLCNQKMAEELLESHKLTRCLKKSKNEVIYHCPACEFSYNSHTGIKRHIRRYHLCPPSNLTCTMCSKTFSTADHLQSHFCPTREKQPCSHCGLTMYREFWLLHSIKEKCKICKLEFPCTGLCLRHKTERVSCLLCKMAFCDSSLLEKHMAEIHNDEVPWKQTQFEELGNKCYSCKVHFEDAESLNQHNLKKHAFCFCNLCGSLCKNKDDLENHLSSVHCFINKVDNAEENLLKTKVELFRCTVCNKLNIKSQDLKSHLKDKHPDYHIPTTSTLENNINKTTLLNLKKSSSNSSAQKMRGCRAAFIKNYFCSICNYICAKKVHLINHNRKKHNLKEVDVLCPICNQVFSDNIARKSHFCKSKPKVVCEFCNCSMYSEYLANHQLIADCSKCCIKFPCENLLKIHHLEESENLYCPKCDNVFCEVASLISHFKEKHKNSELDMSCWKGKRYAQLGFPCYKCKLFFPDLSHLSLHQVDQHPEKSSCELCGLLFTESLYNGQQHRILRHKVPKGYKYTPHFNCKVCKMDFETKKHLMLHIQQDHIATTNIGIWKSASQMHLSANKSSASCSKSSDKPVYKVFFQGHCVQYEPMSTSNLIVSETRDFICDACGMDFDTKELVEEHVMSEHYAEYNIPCLECNAYFKLKTKLNSHSKKNHPEQQDRALPHPYKYNRVGKSLRYQNKNIFYCCCRRTFTQNKHLLNHINIRHIRGGNKCSFCTTICTSIQQLKMHFEVSHLEKYKEMLKMLQLQDIEFFCELCDQRFATEELLETHSYSFHSRTKPMCKVCYKEYTTIKSVRYHMREAHGIAETDQTSQKSEYLCRICNKKYLSLVAAEYHIELSHMSSNNYCTLCMLSFKTKAELRLHTQKICRAKSKCKNCDISFPNSFIAKLHKQKQRSCTFCNKIFCLKKLLVQHIKVDHGLQQPNQQKTMTIEERIRLEHNYSLILPKLSFGQKLQILKQNPLTNSEQTESVTADSLKIHPVTNITPHFVINWNYEINEIKEEIFD